VVTLSAYSCKACNQQLRVRSEREAIDHYCINLRQRTTLERCQSVFAQMREAVEFARFFAGQDEAGDMFYRVAVRCYYHADEKGSIFRPYVRGAYAEAYREFKLRRQLKDN
jgi:hypothetical protein